MKYSKLITILFLSCLFISCEDFLSPEPTSAVPTDEFYTTTEDLQTALVAIYDAIQGVNTSSLEDNRGIQVEFYVAEMYSDNTGSRSIDPDDTSDAGQFENFSVDPGNGISANYYASMYRVIYLANVVLDNLAIVENETTSLSIEAEAKFLRAYAYFNLIRLYGEDDLDLGLPLIDHVLTDDELDTQYTRVSEDEIYNLIISDLELAVTGLDNSYKTRASLGAAQTLLGQVYLTIDEPNYTLATSYLTEVVNSGSYSLQTLDNIFGYENELNDEIIFAIGFEDNAANDSQNYSSEFYADGNTSGVNYLTNDLQAKLYNNEGINVDGRISLYNIDTGDDEDKFRTDKYLVSASGSDQLEEAGADWIVLRYADVIMLLAEAEIGSLGGSDVSDVLSTSWGSTYNDIRERANLSAITTLSKEELLNERRFEFFTENKRLFDLKRFGVVKSVLRDYSNAEGFVFIDGEEILPIPLREINLSPIVNGEHILEQNSAYSR